MEIQWPLVLFTLLSGVGGWLFAGIAVNEFAHKSSRDTFVPSVVAFVLVVLGGFASVLHLSHPERIMNALSHPTSGIFVEAALVGIISVCAIVLLVALKRGNAGLARVFAVLAGVFGIVISFSAGQSYSVMASRAAWDTLLLPLAYLGTAAAGGLSLWWALCARTPEEGGSFGAALALVGGCAGVVTVAAYAAVAGAFSGPYLPYVAGALVCDAVVAVLGAVGLKRPSSALAWGGVALGAVGACCLRVLMWVIGAEVYGFFG